MDTVSCRLGGNFDRWGVQIRGKLLDNPRKPLGGSLLGDGRTICRRCGSRSSAGVASRRPTRKRPTVVLINETFARIGWGGEDPRAE